MFKNGIILKKSSWHRRLINWIYENDTEYKNFCPYFWFITWDYIIISDAFNFQNLFINYGIKR